MTTKTLYTKQSFIDAGYREYDTTCYSADKMFQKRFKDEDGNTRYFIDVCYYDLTVYGGEEKFSVHIGIYDNYDVHHNISMSMEYFSCIEDMENHCRGLWWMFGCNLDALNQ